MGKIIDLIMPARYQNFLNCSEMILEGEPPKKVFIYFFKTEKFLNSVEKVFRMADPPKELEDMYIEHMDKALREKYPEAKEDDLNTHPEFILLDYAYMHAVEGIDEEIFDFNMN